jgi:vacuolar-type H+-ATPase subunit E/Vma4
VQQCCPVVSPQLLRTVFESNKVYNVVPVREVSAAPSPTSLLRCGCIVLGILLAASIGVAGTFAAPKPDPASRRPNDAPKGVKRLWSEYPLNPDRAARSHAPSPRTAEPSPAEARDDSGGTPTPLLFTLAVTVFGLLAVAVLLLARGRVPTVATALRGRPSRRLALPELALARPLYSGLRIPRGPKGGQTMSYFRRLRGAGSDDDSGPRNEDVESSAKRFAPYSLGASGETPAGPDRSREKQGGQNRSPGPEPVARAAQQTAVAPNDPAVYEHLGEHVTTVLSSADEAAKRLQASATKEADRIRGEAEDYARKTRAAADAYAEQRREGAETQASAITAGAEKRAREVRTAAEEQATDIQRDAVRRREALLQESERSEERLRNLLKVFRAMTERLENLVSTPGEASSRAVDEPDTPVDDDLTEALAQSPSLSSGGSREPG